MIKLNKKDPMFAEILWVTDAIEKNTSVELRRFLHVNSDPNCIWASNGSTLHRVKLKKKQKPVPVPIPIGNFEVIKKTKAMLWLEPIILKQPVFSNFGELDQSYARLRLAGSGSKYWIDYCHIIRNLAQSQSQSQSQSQKIFNIEMFKIAHRMPGECLTAWISPDHGLPLVLQTDCGCEAVIVAYSL